MLSRLGIDGNTEREIAASRHDPRKPRAARARVETACALVARDFPPADNPHLQAPSGITLTVRVANWLRSASTRIIRARCPGYGGLGESSESGHCSITAATTIAPRFRSAPSRSSDRPNAGCRASTRSKFRPSRRTTHDGTLRSCRGGSGHRAVYPPSISRSAPVMYDDSSLAR